MAFTVFNKAVAAFLLMAAGADAEGAARSRDALAPDIFEARREGMVDFIRSHHPRHPISDPRVLAALRKVPRHRFVPEALAARAYEDSPLPIGHGQTISQPFIVAAMTQALKPGPKDRVLEIGTGSGYQAAILAELAEEVYTIEIVEPLARGAEKALREQGYRNVHVRAEDGYLGWPEKAPFDAILVTCAPDHVPAPLIDQLKIGGRLVIPVGGSASGEASVQELRLLRKTSRGMVTDKLMDVRFVPMTRER